MNDADPTPATMPDALALADHEAAALLGCSRSHFRNMDRLGMIPAPVRLGRSTKWRRDELIDWLNANCPPRHRWNWRPMKGGAR